MLYLKHGKKLRDTVTLKSSLSLYNKYFYEVIMKTQIRTFLLRHQMIATIIKLNPSLFEIIT